MGANCHFFALGPKLESAIGTLVFDSDPSGSIVDIVSVGVCAHTLDCPTLVTPQNRGHQIAHTLSLRKNDCEGANYGCARGGVAVGWCAGEGVWAGEDTD